MSIHLGNTPNLEKIYLGQKELQFVYLGTEIVWQNNAGPAFSNVAISGAGITPGDSITMLRNTAYTITANVTDLEGDLPFTAKLFRGDTQVDTDKTVTTQGGAVSFTIPANTYDDADEVGEQDPALPWRLEGIDAVDADASFNWTVGELDFEAPTTGLNRSGTVVGSAASLSYSWNAQNDTTGVNLALTTTIDGNSVVNSGSSSVSATCGGTTDVEVVATTTGGGKTETTTNTFTYSRTAANTSTSCGGYGSCSANAPTKCTSTLTTCTASGSRTRSCTTSGIRICDGAVLSSNTFTQSISCSDSNTNTGYVGSVSISGPSSWKDNETGTYTASLPSLGGGVTVSNYNWSVSGGASIDSGQGTSSIVVSGDANDSGSVSLVVTFSNVAEGTTTRTSNSISYNVIDNTFTCAVAGLNVPNGTTGTAVTGITVSQGSALGVSPSIYQNGTATYSVGVRAPAGFSNANSIITCTDTAVGTTVNFACSDAGYSVSDGDVGDSVSASVSAGTLVSNSPSTYQLGSNTYTGTITAPSGYTNSGSNITCTDTATGEQTNSITNCYLTASPLGLDISTGSNRMGPNGTLSVVYEGTSMTLSGTLSCSCNSKCVQVSASGGSYTVNVTVSSSNTWNQFIGGSFFSYTYIGAGFPSEAAAVANCVRCTCTWSTSALNGCTTAPVNFNRSVY